MRKNSIIMAAVMVLILTSCEKAEITPSKSNPKEKLKMCRTCEGQWDLTDSTKRG